MPVDLIGSDQVRCSQEGFVRIWEKGYRRIGLVTSRWAERNTLFRAGFLWAHSESAGEPIPMLGLMDQSEASFAEDVGRLDAWMREARPDAILTDLQGMPKMLAALGHVVPETVGLAILRTPKKGLAGISQNSEEVGRIAAEMLITLIQRGIRGIPAAYRLHLAAPVWVDGASLPPRTTPS